MFSIEDKKFEIHSILSNDASEFGEIISLPFTLKQMSNFEKTLKTLELSEDFLLIADFIGYLPPLITVNDYVYSKLSNFSKWMNDSNLENLTGLTKLKYYPKKNLTWSTLLNIFKNGDGFDKYDGNHAFYKYETLSIQCPSWMDLNKKYVRKEDLFKFAKLILSNKDIQWDLFIDILNYRKWSKDQYFELCLELNSLELIETTYELCMAKDYKKIDFSKLTQEKIYEIAVKWKKSYPALDTKHYTKWCKLFLKDPNFIRYVDSERVFEGEYIIMCLNSVKTDPSVIINCNEMNDEMILLGMDYLDMELIENITDKKTRLEAYKIYILKNPSDLEYLDEFYFECSLLIDYKHVDLNKLTKEQIKELLGFE